MKKVKYLLFVLIPVLIFSSVGVFVYNTLNPVLALNVGCYTNKYETLHIGKIRAKNPTYLDRLNSVTFLPNDSAKVIEKAKESQYYVGERTVNTKKGYYFVKNNNSYLLYENDNGGFSFVNLYSTLVFYDTDNNGERNSTALNFSAPAKLDLYREENKSIRGGATLSEMYNSVTYEEAKNFYVGYDNEFIKTDDEEQKIYIKAYDDDNGNLTENYAVILDFKNKDMGFYDNLGELNWLTEFNI